MSGRADFLWRISAPLFLNVEAYKVKKYMLELFLKILMRIYNFR